MLQRLAEEHGRREWDAVSRQLAAAMAAAGAGGGTRPPLACLQRHQQLLAQAGRAGSFDTGEGLARLAALVAKHGSTWKVTRGPRCAALCRARRAPGSQAGRAATARAGAPRDAVGPPACPARPRSSCFSCCLPLSAPPARPQLIADEFGGGWDPDQLMHIWRRHAQRGPAARKGKWTPEEDDALLKVRLGVFCFCGGCGGVPERGALQPAGRSGLRGGLCA